MRLGMASLLGNYASSEEDEEEEGVKVAPKVRHVANGNSVANASGTALADSEVCFDSSTELPKDLQRPGALEQLAKSIRIDPYITGIPQDVLPWGVVSPDGEVDALVEAAQTFTRNVTEGRQAPGNA